MSHPTVTEAADKFRAAVEAAPDVTVAVMSVQLKQMTEQQEHFRSITKDLAHLPYADFGVIFEDAVNHVVVVEDIIAGRKGDYKYTSALHDGKRWRRASSYWDKVELAYMQGIAEIETRGFSSEQSCLSQGPKAVKGAVRANPGSARISATFTCIEVR